MQTIVRHITNDAGRSSAVVTHEHWITSQVFIQAQDEFKKLPIGEVWLAWTEKPGDTLAKQLSERKAKTRKAVNAAIQKLKLSVTPSLKSQFKR